MSSLVKPLRFSNLIEYQTITTILSNPAKSDTVNKQTLIVAPVSILDQWIFEFHRKIKPPNRLAVHLHHGRDRFQDAACFKDFDVVVTSCSVMVGEWSAGRNKLQRNGCPIPRKKRVTCKTKNS
jgi:hypothetical protein